MKLYLIECFQLCWLMAIQEPPVVLGTETMYAQDVDLNLYTRCTRYGNRQKYKTIRGGESRTGRIEQHAGDKHDLVKMTLHTPIVEIHIHGAQHGLKTHNPVAITSSESSSGVTCDSLYASKDQSRDSGIGYQLQPVVTTYTKVSDERQQACQISPPTRNVSNDVQNENPGILTPKIKEINMRGMLQQGIMFNLKKIQTGCVQE
ncbi:hypothetical protein CHS0354_000002 [Potamilus streckersoni]|uniref:Uncharacterized protein n=1 Tax=Potamilus streckersoni TaxID=2493646 RepID=A0AAE0SPY5_9BIVA|nr:hypothetical protein CHS0354_000002 [Potamilus streckersoni]